MVFSCNKKAAQEQAAHFDTPEDWRLNKVTARFRSDKKLDDKENTLTQLWKTVKGWLGYPKVTVQSFKEDSCFPICSIFERIKSYSPPIYIVPALGIALKQLLSACKILKSTTVIFANLSDVILKTNSLMQIYETVIA